MRHGSGETTDFLSLLAARAAGASLSTYKAGGPNRSVARAEDLPERVWIAGPPCPSGHFRGFLPESGESQESAWKRTLCALSQLAQTMAEVGGSQVGDDWFNPRIPAGYTYLGQFIAHDLVQSMPAPVDPVLRTRPNRRDRTLVLDAVYAGGPEASPWLYEPGDGPDDPRIRLRLGTVTSKPGSPLALEDVCRIDSACPHSPTRRGVRSFDPVVGDIRNDDNLIVSQLVVLFHAFHNRLVDLLGAAGGAGRNDHERRFGMRSRFEAARLLTIWIFRRIVVEDYLPRILRPDVLERHRDRYDAAMAGADARTTAMQAPGFVEAIPIEFAMAAFRHGHAMVTPHYHFSVDRGHSHSSLTRLLGFAAAREDDGLMPLDDPWIIEWERFFFDGTGAYASGNGERNFSRRIRPAVVSTMASHPSLQSDDGAPGGLVYRTLARGFANELWNGQGLAERLCIGDRLSAGEIGGLLEEYSALTRGLAPLPAGVVEMLAQDTPLFLYILAEAELRHDGEHLGELGSEIVARVIFDRLIASHAALPDWVEASTGLLGDLRDRPTMEEFARFGRGRTGG